MATINDKVDAIQAHLNNLKRGVTLLGPNSEGIQGTGGWTWDAALKSVGQLEDAVREVRKVVRARATKDKRASCAHPDSHRGVEGSCLKCGQTKLDPGPAWVICNCGHRRCEHHTDSKESCRFFHTDAEGPRCSGFKPAAEHDLKDCPNPDCFRLNQGRPEPISVRVGTMCSRCLTKVELTDTEQYDRDQEAAHDCDDDCRSYGCKRGRRSL